MADRGRLPRGLAGIGGALILAALLAAPVSAQQSSPAGPRTFDYWQPEWMVRELWGPGKMPKGMMVRLLRHTIFTNYGVPKEYEGAKSTAEGPQALTEGRRLYTAQCASCHGRDGMGEGEPGRAVAPSPALLAFMIRRPIAVDEYLLWAISDGGKQFDSEMPAFKDKLSRNDIWRIIAYMRAGFPESAVTPK